MFSQFPQTKIMFSSTDMLSTCLKLLLWIILAACLTVPFQRNNSHSFRNVNVSLKALEPFLELNIIIAMSQFVVKYTRLASYRYNVGHMQSYFW